MHPRASWALMAVVPDLVGWAWPDALAECTVRGLRVESSTPADLTTPVVTAQDPEAGADLWAGATLWLWTDWPEGGGGAAGDREPLHPAPNPPSLSAEADGSDAV